MRVFVADTFPDQGLDILRRAGVDVSYKTDLKGDALKKEIAEADGVIVRSATKLTADVIAAGPGTQTFRDPVTHERFWQATINLVGNFSWGTSVSGLTKSLRMERLRMQAPVATPAPVVVQPVAIETKIIERPQPAKPAAVPATEAAPEIAPKSTGIRP